MSYESRLENSLRQLWNLSVVDSCVKILHKGIFFRAQNLCILPAQRNKLKSSVFTSWVSQYTVVYSKHVLTRIHLVPSNGFFTLFIPKLTTETCHIGGSEVLFPKVNTEQVCVLTGLSTTAGCTTSVSMTQMPPGHLLAWATHFLPL